MNKGNVPAGGIAVLVAAAWLIVSGSAKAADWPDTPLGRAEAMAALESLNAALLAHDSATLTLDQWCTAHHLAAPGTLIIAEQVHGTAKSLPAGDRQLLAIGDSEAVKYRHVRLRCGAHVLSDADNWYVPARLSPAMNEALDTTNVAFGRAVQPLHFRRQTLGATLLWSPLPEGWDTGSVAMPPSRGGTLDIPDAVIRHSAILRLPDGTPFSRLVETYTKDVLDFVPPR